MGSPLDPLYAGLAPDPDAEYGSILPYAKNRVGSASWVQNGPGMRWALPGMVREGLKGYLDLARGMETGQLTPEAMQTVAFGGMGAGAAMAPRGSLAAGGVLPRVGIEGRVAGPYIRDEGWKSLRDRYGSILYEASGRKAPNRIKLTDERMAKAAELLSQRQAIRTEFLGASAPAETTQQMRDAVAFARESVRAGHDTRFKVPDGPYGSLYVRSDDKTVRFSDHPQPTEGGRVVGGYSKTLGRRHYPADVSVSPRESTLDDVLALLRKYGLMAPAPVAVPGGNTGKPTPEQRQLMNPGLL